MAGTVAGGKKAAKTIKLKHGMDFYVVMGAAGGRKSKGGGFSANRALAKEAGSKGGKIAMAKRWGTPEKHEFWWVKYLPFK